AARGRRARGGGRPDRPRTAAGGRPALRGLGGRCGGRRGGRGDDAVGLVAEPLPVLGAQARQTRPAGAGRRRAALARRPVDRAGLRGGGRAEHRARHLPGDVHALPRHQRPAQRTAPRRGRPAALPAGADPAGAGARRGPARLRRPGPGRARRPRRGRRGGGSGGRTGRSGRAVRRERCAAPRGRGPHRRGERGGERLMAADRDGGAARGARRRRPGPGAALIAAALGAFLLTSALMLRFYVYEQLALVPAGTDLQLRMVDEDASYLDTSTWRTVKDAEVIRQTEISGGLSAGNPGWATWEMSTDTTSGSSMIGHMDRRVIVDRSTGRAVNCCGEHVGGDRAVRQAGLVLYWPA